MKGVILAGGLGTRLSPLTNITNKHLLPVYNKPMILYPLEALKRMGISEIMIVCGKEHAGHFMNFLGSGKEYGVKLSYSLQHGAGGIAEALGLARDFADGSKIAVILGDNFFEDTFASEAKSFESQDGAVVFLKEVSDAHRFGVAEVSGETIVHIEEKPKQPKTNLAQTGLYFYNSDVFEKIKNLKPSARGELEITDIQNMYIAEKRLRFYVVKGYWSDMGSFTTLLKTSQWVADHQTGA